MILFSDKDKDNRKIFCIGETVLDIIFRNDRPISATPGGSMLNSAVSLGRAGIPVYLISDYAMDHAGDLVNRFLLGNGVSTEYISRYPDGKTALALAFLDEQKNADYSFYKIFPAERMNIPMPATQTGDIVLFGSFYSLDESVRKTVVNFIRQARSQGAFIIYDPNFRKAHLDELEKLRPLILENISMADLVRGSDEDFSNIFNASGALEAFGHVNRAGCPLLVYTKGSEGVEVISTGYSLSYTVPQIEPVSTIGAGDSFNAGIIHAMIGGDILVTPTESSWDHIIARATGFAANVCRSIENYISTEFGSSFLKSNP